MLSTSKYKFEFLIFLKKFLLRGTDETDENVKSLSHHA